MENIWFDVEEYRRLIKKYENNINIDLLNIVPIESAKTSVKGNNIDSIENKKGNEKGE